MALCARNIVKTQFFKLFNKPVPFQKNRVVIRKFSGAGVLKTLPIFTRYFCFAVVNIMSVANAEKNDSASSDSSKVDIENAIKQSDELFSVGKFQESANILKPYEDSNDVEVLWRISRALYNMSKAKGIKSSENASLIKESYKFIEKALEIEKKNFSVHKWMAILYDAKCALDGMKARINGLPIFKEHLMTAIELNPKDATSIYMLGQYMYNIADMSWLQKTIAKTLFGTPPEASFEEAFHYFTKAEEVDPNFYSANLLMLGKTCMKLKKIETGCYWLRCAVAYPVRTDEDEAVRLEAEELLRNYPEYKNPTKEEEKKS